MAVAKEMNQNELMQMVVYFVIFLGKYNKIANRRKQVKKPVRMYQLVRGYSLM